MKNKSKLFNIIVFTLFIIIILIMSFHHENWRDEAQAYLLCRDMNLFQLFKNIHYEGHPIIYYLFLYPLVKLGVGPKSVNILAFVFMSISVFLILFKSKLNNIQKLCIIMSYPVLYEFSIIGRSYSLCFLLLTIYGLLYSNKDKYPIWFSIVLGLLLNTHILMAGFVGINVLVFYVYEIFKNKKKTNKKIIIGFSIILLFSLLLFIQFYPMLVSNNGMSLSKSNSIGDYISIFLIVLFGGCGVSNVITITLSIIVFSFIYVYLFKKDKLRFFILIISYLYMACLMNFIFDVISSYSLDFVFSILLVIILSFKNSINSDKKITIYLVFIVLFSLFNTIRAYSFEYNKNYSSAYKTSKYINKNISSDSIFICNDDALCSSIIPYVDNKFYSTKTNKYFTYVIWNKEREESVDYNKLEEYIDSNSSLYYIVANYDYEEDMDVLNKLKNKYTFEKIFVSDNSNFDSVETYTLYKIK